MKLNTVELIKHLLVTCAIGGSVCVFLYEVFFK
jgi:hypothetical protein